MRHQKITLLVIFELCVGNFTVASDQDYFRAIRILRSRQGCLIPSLIQTTKSGGASIAVPFLVSEKIIDRMQIKLGPQEFNQFLDWYHAHFFYDREQIFLEAIQTLQEPLSHPKVYDKKGERPFDGYLAAKQYLETVDPNHYDLDLILTTHTHLMSRRSIRSSKPKIRFEDGTTKSNSEGISDLDLGKIREVRAGENETGDTPIKDFSNSMLQKTGENFVEYLPLSQWRNFQEQLSSKTINSLEGLSKKFQNLDLNHPEINPTRQKAITELLKSEIELLKNKLIEAKTQEDIIQAAGKFFYRFLSIHPFKNGNGRTARLLLECILNKYGMPSPLAVQFGEDIVHSQLYVIDHLKDSIQLSNAFHQQLDILTKAGMDYRSGSIAYLLGSPDYGEFIPEEFMTWLKIQKHKYPSSLSALRDFFEWRFLKSNRKAVEHEEDGGLRLATPLFLNTFGILSKSEAAFKLKLHQHYYKTPLFRGTAATHYLTDQEVIEHFIRFQPATVGNGISPSALVSMKQLFETEFNSDMMKTHNEIRHKSKDHVSGGYEAEGYLKSHMLSLSREANVAIDWSHGMQLEMQTNRRSSLRSSLAIEVFSRKAAALDQVNGPRELVDQKYAGEREVSFFGGIDPESINKIKIEDWGFEDPKVLNPGNALDPNRLFKMRKAIRLDYRTILLKEYQLKRTGNGPDSVYMAYEESDYKLTKETLYEISPDGRFKVIQKK